MERSLVDLKFHFRTSVDFWPLVYDMQLSSYFPLIILKVLTRFMSIDSQYQFNGNKNAMTTKRDNEFPIRCYSALLLSDLFPCSLAVGLNYPKICIQLWKIIVLFFKKSILKKNVATRSFSRATGALRNRSARNDSRETGGRGRRNRRYEFQSAKSYEFN